jgi:predicted peroxiredoxin
MASILVHITHGPEHPSRAALGFHVAKAAVDEGHSVTVFLAGDAVQLMREGVLDHLTGLGTGNLRQLYDALAGAGVTVYLSGMSSKSRGLSETELEGKNYNFGGPPDLVRLALEHDQMFTY